MFEFQRNAKVQSGLGLEAQRSAVADFCRVNGCEIVAEYREVESGRKNDRPILQKALAHAKRLKATLLIAKLDRLARNVHFISGLLEANVEFRACDLPEASKFILHVMAAVAAHEAKAISDRTRVALQAAKERGIALGAANPACRNLDDTARLKGARHAGLQSARACADYYSDVSPRLRSMRDGGLTLRTIAETLNEEGVLTRTGGAWSLLQVKRVLERAA